MKRAIVLLLLLWGVTHCRNGGQNVPRLDAARLTQLNGRLSEKALAPRVLVNKIEISCQNRVKALNRDLTRLEYLALLRDEHLAALPEEMQGREQALDDLARGLAGDTLDQILAANREWAVPLPNAYGDTWISITREGLAQSRRQGQAVLGWLEDEKLLDEPEREGISERIEESVLLFPHQIYDLILRELREPDQEPH
ncbi:MAG: hypothetical protein ICV83_23945 [Cytophagales bacterium]|nr:hypothetical protein [Cytophagales bacterium]